MDIQSGYHVFAEWERDCETPTQLAIRVFELARLLKPLMPDFTSWYRPYYDKVGTEPLNYNLEDLSAIIKQTEYSFGNKQRAPRLGYEFYMYNNSVPEMRPDGWHFMMYGGGDLTKQRLDLLSHCEGMPDAQSVTYPIIKGAVLAIAKAFEPDWCAAAPDDLGVVDDMGRYEIAVAPRAWMINLSPRLTPLVVPPRSAIHEYGADGSLFMTATTETFVTQNPTHLAAAQAIFAVIDPLNFRHR